MIAGRAPRRGALRASLLAVALALPGACAVHDDLTWHPWVPVAEIDGPLRPELVNGHDAPPPASGLLRVVTYNVHLGEELDGVAAALRDDPVLKAADVLQLEEIEAHPADAESQAARLGALLGMNHVYAPAWTYPDGGTHGLALLSRYPIAEARVMELPFLDLVHDSERRIALAATLTIGDRTLEVITIHLDTRINVNQRLQQLQPAVVGAAATSVVGGDFNTNPFVWVDRQLPAVPQDAAAPIDAAGAVDEFMGYHHFAAATAGTGDTLNAIVSFRCDSVYARGLAPRAAGVQRSVTSSDHFPVWADLAWPP